MYVIWLTSESDIKRIFNAYGYWSGKNYTVQGELFPITDSGITGRTKIYTSKKRAEKGLEACLNKGYAYVMNGEVIEIGTNN